MAILINDIETEQYAKDIAARHGRLSKSAAMRLIAEEHKQFSIERALRDRHVPSFEANTANQNSGRAAAAAS